MDKALADTMRALTAYQSATQDADASPPEGYGEAADGLVKARTGPPGRVTSLEVDPRLLRLDLATVTEHVVEAVNAALADLQQAVPAAGPVDLGDLGRQLTAIQQDAARQLTMFVNGLAAAQDRLGRRDG
ncbi:YbaB/EbfC family nucleoid-associated protein [Micromonospora thermarum]|uniref:YbaB/EbfC family nucleoid-associated protein n=1 Tax=Micromonospora thermarum TaxID=2720024 RepID=A0ABX0Z807_9ACTN|nr:YbaB/EbfC family nucleoid-associated protein [Micromonospora thermarum]NJP32075.1 YbaB/EbfC family nucleoid-associated protein [Micromonospora thermarum]